MPTTTPWNIQYPDGDSAITPLQDRFYELANTTNSAINTAKATLDDDISDLQDDVTAINSRLALNLQEGSGTPSGAPSNSGHEGSMYWDYTNDMLYAYVSSEWKKVWERSAIVKTADVVTAASGWTLVNQSYLERNGICQLSVNLKRTGSTIAAGNISNTLMGTIAASYGPAIQTAAISGGSGNSIHYITDANEIYASSAITEITGGSSGDTVTVNATYIKE
jgi:hypothetical protein